MGNEQCNFKLTNYENYQHKPAKHDILQSRLLALQYYGRNPLINLKSINAFNRQYFIIFEVTIKFSSNQKFFTTATILALTFLLRGMKLQAVAHH